MMQFFGNGDQGTKLPVEFLKKAVWIQPCMQPPFTSASAFEIDWRTLQVLLVIYSGVCCVFLFRGDGVRLSIIGD